MTAIDQIDRKEYFSTELLAWYRLNKRDLPWRMNRDPYRVWVSEIMLQQTRVDTVIPYFNHFMRQFPTVKALAEAPEVEVLKCWEGLGYYSRARNLQAGAKAVVEQYDGIIPDDVKAVSALKGVGPYTSGAIMSIAFNRPEPAVDGNVMRVLSRYFLLEEDIAKPSTRKGIEILAAELIPKDAAGDFNQALMELGALVCTPKSPGCLTCPVLEHCSARLEGREAELPVKTKAKPPRLEHRAAVIVQGSGSNEGKVLVRQRPDSGLLAQMWELPHVLVPSSMWGEWEGASAGEREEWARLLGTQLQVDMELLVRPRAWYMDADHVFSHIHWVMRVFTADLGEESDLLESGEGGVGGGSGEADHDGLGGHEGRGDRGDRVGHGGRCDRDGHGGLACVSSSNSSGGSDNYSVAAEGGGDYAAAATEVLNQPSHDELPPTYRWIGQEDMTSLPFPNLFLRILREYWQRDNSIDK